MSKFLSKVGLVGILGFLLSLVFVVACLKPSQASNKNLQIDGIYVSDPKELTDFHLTNNKGQPFTKENLKGQWTLLFFGFTNCGMVCPTTLAALNGMMQLLQKDLSKDQLPQVVMITVDPERDSITRLNEYVTSFNPNFMGAQGDETQIELLKKQLHIVAVKMQADGKGKNHYTMDHSAEIMLINPKAQVQAFLSYPHQAEQMAKDFKQILNTSLKDKA